MIKGKKTEKYFCFKMMIKKFLNLQILMRKKINVDILYKLIILC